MGGKIFDVIIPYYNKEKYILRAINSIDTTYVNNIFVIDDHSEKDISKKINKKNIIYIRLKKNRGPSFCRNYGAQKSTSKYILFLDADDYYHSELFKRLYNEIESYNQPLIISWKIKKILSKQMDKNEVLVPSEIKDQFFYISEKLNNHQVMTSSSFCIHRDYFLSEGGFNEKLRIQEDPELFCRLSCKTKIIFISNTYSYYDISTPESLSKINLTRASLPLYVDNLLSYNDEICLKLFKKEFIKYYLLALIEKENHYIFLEERYMNNFSLLTRLILKILSFTPSYLFKKLYILFRYAKYNRTK